MASLDWRLVICGTNHSRSTLEEREPLQVGQEEIASAHAAIVSQPGIVEAVIVSTCNRIEFYLVMERSQRSFDAVRTFYREQRNLDITTLEDRFYVYRGKHAAEHLFRVAAGVDSMVVGENQISTQIRQAYSSSCRVKAAGRISHRLFHHAFRVGKQVRTDTELGRGACSVSSASVELLKARIPREARPGVLFVGVNRTIVLAASAWSKLHHSAFLFANRTREKAVALAARYKARGHSLTDLPQLLSEADIVITSTGASQPVITTAMIDAALAARPDHRLLIMDMAVPRDTDVAKDHSERVTVFDLSDVQAFVRQRQQERLAAVPDAERIIEQRLGEFAYWYDHVRHELSRHGLSDVFHDIYRRDMQDALDELTPEDRHRIDEAAERLLRHLALVKLRESELKKPSE
jgi:glutamyl-tRNA reductase